MAVNPSSSRKKTKNIVNQWLFLCWSKDKMLEGKSKFNVSNVCCNRIFTRPMLHTGSYVPTSRCIAENLGKRHKNSVCEQHNSQKSPKWKGTHLISIDLELYPIEASKQIQPLGYILMAASLCSVNGYRVRCLPDMAYYLTFFGSAHPLHYKRKSSQVKKNRHLHMHRSSFVAT